MITLTLLVYRLLFITALILAILMQYVLATLSKCIPVKIPIQVTLLWADNFLSSFNFLLVERYFYSLSPSLD